MFVCFLIDESCFYMKYVTFAKYFGSCGHRDAENTDEIVD